MNQPSDSRYVPLEADDIVLPSTATVQPEPVTDTDDYRDENATPEIVEARAQIEETRTHLTETIDAIKDKLSPANLMAEAKESAKAATVEAAHDLKDKAGEIVGTVVDKAKSAAATASDVIHNAADYMTEKTAPMMESAKQQMAPAMDAARSAVDGAKNLGTTAKGAGETIVDTIRTNPIPFALIAIGVGWLLAAPRRTSVGDNYKKEYDYENNSDLLSDRSLYEKQNLSQNNGSGTPLKSAGDAVSSFASDTKDKVSDLASSTKDKIGDMASSTKDRISDMASSAKQQASDLASTAKQQAGTVAGVAKEKTQQTVSFVDQWVHEEPLAAGAIALLVGAAVGLALPGTDQENQWFGPKRDELAQRATETAQDMAGKVQNVAQNVLGSAKEAIGNAADQVKSDFQQEARDQGLVTAS